MKNINKIILICITSILIYSCDTNNEVTGYDPANYEYTIPTTFTLTEKTAATKDTSFVATYTPSSPGKGYYVVVAPGTDAPTSTQVHSGGDSFLQAGVFDVDGSTPVDITVNNSGIYGSYTYDVYAIHKSTDNFISEETIKLSVTTPDTMEPMFLAEDSSPSFSSEGNSPLAPVTFTFSEPVFYQGGDIVFTGFSSERIITVNDASVLSMSGTSITVDTHGTFAQDDYIIVTWEADTFKDNSGKSVAPLSGFSHYFGTRSFTPQESAYLMQGTWEYSTTFYGGLEAFYDGNSDLFLPDTGQFELKLDPSDPEVLTLLL